jgi:N-acetylneuraminate synthase
MKLFENFYFIAEIGVNHGGSLSEAFKLVDSAKLSGANAAKFQAYSAESIAALDSPAYWDLSSEPISNQFKLFSKYDKFRYRDYLELSDYCKSKAIDFAVTCFDVKLAQELNELVKYHKIASADITNYRLIDEISSFRKPVILSTGAATFREIEFAVSRLARNEVPKIGLMHCVLNYPTKFENANLKRISKLIELYPDLSIGYSDHTIPRKDNLALFTSISLGATFIEKHFTITPEVPGNDHYHSFNPTQLSEFLLEYDTFCKANFFEESEYISIQESARQNARRGIYANKDIPINKVIDLDDIIELRPSKGILSEELDQLIGREIQVPLQEGAPLFWSQFKMN